MRSLIETLSRHRTPLIGLAAVLVGSLLAYLSVRTITDYQSQLAEQQEANQKLADAIERIKRMRATSTGGVTAFTDDYLENAQEGLATAELQNHVRALAAEQSIELSSLNTLTRRQVDEAPSVGVRVSFAASLAATQALLHALETRQPLLFIDRTTLRPRTGFDNGPGMGQEPGRITADVEVRAPLRPAAVNTRTPTPIRLVPRPGGAQP